MITSLRKNSATRDVQDKLQLHFDSSPKNRITKNNYNINHVQF